MAEAEKGGGFLDSVEDGIVNNWPWLLIIILGYFLWHYNFLNTFLKEVLILAGVFFLGGIAWKIWVHYVQQDFISGIDFVLLEIIPPRDVLRSPKAMELFITNALYHFSFKGGKEEYWQGAVWFWFSLELVSIEGQVHFYIRTPTRIRNLIETQMYAQYPQSQVKVVEDYTLAVDEITPKSDWSAWGCEFGLINPEAFPIKTYIDFGLDDDPKEEYKVDPISPVIELFGALDKGEQVWLQIIITPADKTKTWRTKGTWFGRHGWAEESKVQIAKLLLPYTSQREDPGPGLVKLARIEVRTPDIFKDTVKKVVEKTNKVGFETGIRLMYVAKKENFNNNFRKDIRLIFRQYQNPDSNGFNRINSAQGDALNSSVLMLSPLQIMTLANRKLHAYREREFFRLPLRHHIFSIHVFEKIFPKPIIHAIFMTIIKPFFLPYQHPETFVLNTEELATIWHFPGQILKVPTLERIESKEASPPTNLPT